MASSYSTQLRLELMANGENDTTWGTKLNTGLELLEASIAGRAAITHDDSASYTLTTANGSDDEARHMILNIGGALTAARNAVVPTQSKVYIVKNATTGGFAVTVKTSAGTGIAVPNGKTMILFCDGTNVVEGIDQVVGTLALTSPAITTSITTPSTTFTAFAGATTLLTIGGTGATSVFAIPGTLQATGTTGALTVAGGAYIAKALNVAGIITGTAAATPFKHTGTAATNTVVFQGSGYTTGGAYFQLGNTSGAFYAGVESSVGGTIITGSTAYDAAIAGSGLSFSADSGTTLHMRIASTGVVTISNLAGVGSRAVVVDANGVLSAP